MLSEVNVLKIRQLCAWPLTTCIDCLSLCLGKHRSGLRAATNTCASLHSPFVVVSRAFNHLDLQVVSTMNTAVNKVKERTGWFVDTLRSRSCSQSPAPVDHHLSPVSSAPVPPKPPAENVSHFVQTDVAESAVIQPRSLTAEISPAPSMNEPGHNSW